MSRGTGPGAASITLKMLDRVIQIAMGWSDGHMCLFMTGAIEQGLRKR